MIGKIIPSEEDEQAAVVEYLELKGYKFTASNSGMYSKSWKQKAKMKKTGVRPGFPDLTIILPNKLLFIEMKRKKGGQVSTYQKEWIKALNGVSESVEAFVARGADEAIEIIKKAINK